MSFSSKISGGVLLAALIIIGLALLSGSKTYGYLGFASPASQVAAKPTEECPSGASFIPDQGCTMPLEIITPTLTASAAKTEPPISNGPNPLVVWIEEELGWKVSPGSPEFALYDSGLLIFRNPKISKQDLNQYLSVSLSEAERDQLLKTLAIPETFFELADTYDNPDVTDLPWHTLMVWDQARFKRVRVYGDVRNDKADYRPIAPEALLQLFDKLVSFHPPQKTSPWLPERVEINLWPASTSPTQLPVWPDGWPALNHPETIKTSDKTYTIFLDRGQLEQLGQLVDPSSPKIVIGGQAWAFNYRYLFPNEELWR